MAEDTLRSVRIDRTAPGRYTVHNVRGGSLVVGSATDGDDHFTPVELLLAAIGSCTAVDVDLATSRHATPSEFTVTVTGDKIADDSGNHLVNLAVSFSVTFPLGEAGDRARTILPRAIRTSHDRLCTVSRTVELGTPVSSDLAT